MNSPIKNQKPSVVKPAPYLSVGTPAVQTSAGPISPAESQEKNLSSAPRENPGEVLKRAREKQGLSLEIVHETTKIPMDALRAIEEGYKLRILSSFYYKGFIKMYADYLGIEASKVIFDYKEEVLPTHIQGRVSEEEKILSWAANILTRERKQKLVIAAGILLVVFFVFKVMSWGMTRATDRASAKTKPVKIAPAKMVESKKSSVKTEPVQPEVKPSFKVIETVQQEKPRGIPPSTLLDPPVPEPQVAAAPLVPSKETPDPAPPVVVVKEITLTVRAKENSWLRVKSDGALVFQSTLRSGAVETWNASDEIEIAGKNISQLEFELNGKMIGTLGRGDRNAKKVIVNRRGLSVKK